MILNRREEWLRGFSRSEPRAILNDVMRLGPIGFRVWMARWMMVFGCFSAGWSHAAEIGSGAPADALRPDPYASIHALEINAVTGVQKVGDWGR